MSQLNRSKDLNKSAEIIEINESIDKKEYRKSNTKDGGWGWVIVIGSFISHMLNDGIIYSYGVLTPVYINHFGISRSTVGWMGSTLLAVTLLTGPLASYLCKVFSYRTVAVAGSIISALGFGAPYFYPQLWFLIFSSSIVCGIGFGLVYLPSIIMVNEWFEKKRSLAIGIAVSGEGLGTFIFSPLLEFLLATFDWQITMLITAGILLLLIPCVLTYSRFDNNRENDIDNFKTNEINGKIENCVEMKLLSDNNAREIDTISGKNMEIIIVENDKELIENDNLNAKDDYEERNSISLLEIVKNPIFVLISVSCIFTDIGFNAPSMFAKDRAIQSGTSANQGSFLISSMGIGNFIGRVGFGYLATLKTVNRYHLHNATLIISGLVLIFSWCLNYYILMILYTLVYGMMVGGFIALTSVILVDIFGNDNLDATFSLSLAIQGISSLLGPPFAGFVYDATLSYNISFAICGIFVTISGVIMYLAYISKDFRKTKFTNN